MLLRCTECGGRIGYDSNYDKMACEKCGEKFTIHDIKAMMEADDDERKRMFTKKKKTKVMIAPGFDDNDHKKKEELESSITINVGW